MEKRNFVSKEVLRELEEMEKANKVYYKILPSHKDGRLTIACLQWFDEYDYDQELFWKDRNGRVLQFDTKDEAAKWLNDNIKSELIDPEYLRSNNKDYWL